MNVKMSSGVGMAHRKQAMNTHGMGYRYNNPWKQPTPVRRRPAIQRITAPISKRVQTPTQYARPQRITAPVRAKTRVGARIKAPVSQTIRLSGAPKKIIGERIKPPVGMLVRPGGSQRVRSAPAGIASSSAPLR